MRLVALITTLSLTAVAGCLGSEASQPGGVSSSPARSRASTEVDAPRGPQVAAPSTVSPVVAEAASFACRKRAAALLASENLPGAPAFDAARAEILGRARGEPMVLVDEPSPTPDAELTPAELGSRRAFERGVPGRRVIELARRHAHDPVALRKLVLRDGYVYTADPLDAFELVRTLEISDLFGDPEVWLARGHDVRRLVRDAKKRDVVYRWADGDGAGRAAELLFGDRIAADRESLAAPLHRDLASLAGEVGFERARIVHARPEALVADLRFGRELWARAVIETDGAAAKLGCLAEDAPVVAAVDAARKETEIARAAIARVREVVSEEIDEGLRFDRPEGETGPDRDGELRPAWLSAYLMGRSGYQIDEMSYPVFDASGRPWPPQVCVDFVADTLERASGAAYRPRGGKPGWVPGRLELGGVRAVDFRGVIAFGRHAETNPDRFEMRRFEGGERIPFRDRSRFFSFLLDHADEIRPGDVVAIQGLKRDDRVHQHAILVERVDPITGFPHGLADQMKRPRRRTWEGIMAEAPARSLWFRARLRPEVLSMIAPPQD